MKCQLDILRETKTPKATRAALQSLPKGLDDTYERILINVPDDAVLLRRALQFIVFAVRPVTLKEVAEAVIVEVGDQCLDKEARLHDPQLLLAICGSLVSYHGQHLGLAHYSVQEFLKSERIHHGPAREFAMTEVNAAIEISEICLTYLAFDDFKNYNTFRNYVQRDTRRRILEDSEFMPGESILQQHPYPFLDYAAAYWLDHVRVPSVEQRIVGLLMKMFSENKTDNLNWFGPVDGSPRCPPEHRKSVLTFTVRIGLEHVFQYLLNNETHCHPTHHFWYEPFYYAALGGFENIMEMLLQHGADINVTSHSGHTALHYLTLNGHHGAVEMLLRYGAIQTDCPDIRQRRDFHPVDCWIDPYVSYPYVFDFPAHKFRHLQRPSPAITWKGAVPYQMLR